MATQKTGLRRLMTAAVAVATAVAFTVMVVTFYGDNIKALFGMSADAMAGDTTVEKRIPREPRLERKTLTSFAAVQAEEAPPPNPTVNTAQDALSTFGIDVDTASWTWARSMVMDHRQLPTPTGVRVEEWVNAFDYELATPTTAPVAISVEGSTSPFDETKTLLKVSLKAREVKVRQPAHLVFLADVSGSMSGADRLPLAKRAMHELVANLTEQDTVALVTYAGSTEVKLQPTSASQKRTIDRAIDALGAGGGTAMGSGMELAYRLAVQQVAPGTTTRVVVLTDGDTNIGPNLTPEKMLAAVHAYVEEGVTLTTVGFGVGNYRGGALEQLADKGNGQALYVSGERDVKKVFQEQLTSTLEVVGKDVKVQVAFDPKVVSSYRLIGYENRAIADEDFKNDRVDAGEMGSGHAVTALYEVALTSTRGALGTVSVRGKHPATGEVFEVAQGVSREVVSHQLSDRSADFRFATAVALAADNLRGNARDAWALSAIAELASDASVGRPERQEFVSFLRLASNLRERPVAARDYNGY